MGRVAESYSAAGPSSRHQDSGSISPPYRRQSRPGPPLNSGEGNPQERASLLVGFSASIQGGAMRRAEASEQASLPVGFSASSQGGAMRRAEASEQASLLVCCVRRSKGGAMPGLSGQRDLSAAPVRPCRSSPALPQQPGFLGCMVPQGGPPEVAPSAVQTRMMSRIESTPIISPSL